MGTISPEVYAQRELERIHTEANAAMAEQYKQGKEPKASFIDGEFEVIDEPKQRCSAFFGMGDPALDEIVCEYISRTYGQ